MKTALIVAASIGGAALISGVLAVAVMVAAVELLQRAQS